MRFAWGVLETVQGAYHLQPQLRIFFVYTQLLLQLNSGYGLNDRPAYGCKSWNGDKQFKQFYFGGKFV